MPSPGQEKLPPDPRIVFLGTPDFAVPCLEALCEDNYDVSAVVTQPDRGRGRGQRSSPTPVKKAALARNLEVLQPESTVDPGFLEQIRNKAPDLLVVVAFGQILKRDLLKIPTWGALNIHASLLPRYRGAAPIHWVILNQETKTGLTAMKMDEGLDSGPILLQEELSIFPDETAGHLESRLSRAAGGFLLRTLKALSQSRLREVPQDSTMATYAPKISREMSVVHWGRSAQSVSALIRGLDPRPGAVTTFQGKEIRLFASRVCDDARIPSSPGKIVGLKDDALEVECGQGIVAIRELQVPGKKRLRAGDFSRGFPLPQGAFLGSNAEE